MTAENRGLSRLILLIAVSVLLAGCPDKGAKQATPQLVQANIGGNNFYIPKSYLNMPYTSVGSESALIQAWYPGDKVVPGDPDDLWRQKQWYKNVRILISRVKISSIEPILITQQTLFQATKTVGAEYGLVHYTQLPEGMADHKDVWIDKSTSETGVFIACDHLENTAKIPAVPQCNQQFVIGHYYLQVHYDRRLLPHWQELQKHVAGLYNSFQSLQSASAYLKTVTEQPQQQEESP